MRKYKCIYCLQLKNEAEFNREHVVPRMMGRYQNAFVLNNNQVCEECNSYFSANLENQIGLDSYEALLRMQYHSAPMSDGHRLVGSRIVLTGDEAIFKGIPFTAITDQTSPFKIRFDMLPMVGIISCPEKQEYDYYSIADLPEASVEVIERIKSTKNSIINTGIPKEELELVLIQKGYLLNRYTYTELLITDMLQRQEFLTAINIKIDSILRRVCAKTVFNYLCFSKGTEYVLNSQFNAIREYIRYGKWSDNLWFRYSKGPVSTVAMPNQTAHMVGYMWYPENGFWVLCGCLTWFGDLTYIFKLGGTTQAVKPVNVMESTKMACFNNIDRVICEDDAVYIYGGKQESCS